MVATVLVSVIIPSGRPEMVQATLCSLRIQSMPRDTYEILVVTPDPAALQQESGDGVRIIATGRLFPPGRMRNIGAREARGDLFCFLDDDCLAPPAFLEQMEGIIQVKGRAGAVGCRLVGTGEGWWDRCADQILFTAFQGRRSGPVAGLGSAALAVRREAFLAVGGFDEELRASEDWDFSLKLREKGWECWFSADVTVRHDHRRGALSAIFLAAWRSGRFSGLVVQRRHLASVSWLARLMAHVGRPAVYWLFMLPYSVLVTVLWLVESRPSWSMLPCLPLFFAARLLYQFGVWAALLDRNRPCC